MKDVSYEACVSYEVWRIIYQPSEDAAMSAYVSWMEAVSKNDKSVITIDRLRELGACEETLDFLSDRFGDAVAITEETALAYAEDISWRWASDNLLNEGQRELYEEACYPRWKAYVEACNQHLKTYQEACAPYWKAHQEACDKHRKTFNESFDKHRKAYDEACAPYWKAYKETCAKAFVTAYYTK